MPSVVGLNARGRAVPPSPRRRDAGTVPAEHSRRRPPEPNDVKMPARESVVARLASAEEQFAEIERLTKELRKRLDRVAETVRTVAAELNHRTTKR